MARFTTVLVTAAMLLSAPPALAAEWKFLSRTRAGDTVEVDTSSIVGAANFPQAWFRFTYSTPYPNGAVSSKMRVALDCENKRFRGLSALEYDPSGRVVRSVGRSGWIDVTPDSAGVILSAAVCAGDTTAVSAARSASCVLNRPIWLAQPSPAAIAAAYSKAKITSGLSRTVTLQCILGSDGRPSACTSVGDRDGGRELEVAALQLAGSYRAAIKTPDGASSIGCALQLTIDFYNEPRPRDGA